MFLVILAVLSSEILHRSLAREGPIVETTLGALQGLYQEDLSGRPYEEYLGIPFAQPPVGELRWKKPLPAEPWEGLLDAGNYSVHCVHWAADLYPLLGLGGEQSEDCLYLNVYVPRGVSQVSDLPVMVYIYGGGYIVGASEMYPGYALAVHGDVIVVNINYRLGLLGFLTTGDSASPGNYGWWDTALSLQWVKDNIASFGGNPNAITIFGQSAGAQSVTSCMFSPWSRDLFQRGIAISGGLYRNFSMILGDRTESTKRLAEGFGCPTDTSQAMVDCLREIDAATLDYDSIFRLNITSWGPVLDYDFLPDEPQVLWESGIPKNHDLIIGNTDHDSAGFVLGNPIALPIGPYNLSSTTTVESTRDYVRNKMAGYTTDPESMTDLIYQRYPNMADEDIDIRSLATTLFDTEMSFASVENKIAEVHSGYQGGAGSTYYYIYEHRHSFLYGYPEFVNASHLDDMYSVLGRPFFRLYRLLWLQQNFDQVDEQVNEHVMSYYANFAYTGNPNAGPNEVPAVWPRYDTTEKNHVVISGNTRAEQLSQDKVDSYKFWIDEWPTLLERDPGVEVTERSNRFLDYVKDFVRNVEEVGAHKVQMLIHMLNSM